MRRAVIVQSFVFALGCSGGGGAALPDAAPAPDARAVSFRRVVLTTEFQSEGATYGDFDRDGLTDVVAGPFWYAGPDFTRKRPLYPAQVFDPKGYSDSFFAFTRDFDGDGWLDVLVVGFPGQAAAWLENPGRPLAPWPRHPVLAGVDTEAPAFTDMDGDGVPELVCAHGGQLGWATPDPADPRAPWRFRAVSPPGPWKPFTHGFGVGDVDGDRRPDLLEAAGIWRQPAGGAAPWSFLQRAFGKGGAQMFATDVDGDGDADVVTSLAAHEYGLAWYEQRAGITFAEHVFSPAAPTMMSGQALHEPHALDLADVDGDGLSDVVTGERFWGHIPAGTPDFGAPALLVWFRLERTAAGARYVRHVIDDSSGVGTQVVAGDVTGDGRADVVVATKKGAFVFLQTPAP